MELLLRIKSLDVMAQPVNLKIGGQNGIKTFFGLSMTVLYILVMAGVILCVGWSYFDTSDPIVTTQPNFRRTGSALQLTQYGWVPAIFGVDSADKLMTYTELLRYVTPILVKVTTSSTGTSTVSNFAIKPCAQVLTDIQFSKFYSQHSTTNEVFRLQASACGLCAEIDQIQYFLPGADSAKIESTTIQVEYHPCSLGAGNCASSSELANVKLLLLEPRRSIDLANQKYPLETYYAFSRPIRLAEELTQTLSCSLGVTKLRDDSGLPFQVDVRGEWLTEQDTVSTSAVRVPSVGTVTLAMVQARTTKPLAIVSYSSCGKQETITRRYTTVIGVIGLVGGAGVILYLFFSTLTRMYVSCIEDSVMVDVIYPHLESTSSVTKALASRGPQSLSNLMQVCSTEDWLKLRQQAATQIRNTLNVEDKVTKSTNVEVLTQMLLNPSQQKVLPLVAVAIQARLDAEQMAQKLQPADSANIHESLQTIKLSYESIQGKIVEELTSEQKTDVYLVSELLNPCSLVGQLFFQFNSSSSESVPQKSTQQQLGVKELVSAKQPPLLKQPDPDTSNLRRVERFHIDDDIDPDGRVPSAKTRPIRSNPNEQPRSYATQATKPARVIPNKTQFEEMVTYDPEVIDAREPGKLMQFSELNSPTGKKGRYPTNQVVQLSRLSREAKTSVTPAPRGFEGPRPVVVWISPDDPNYQDLDDSRYQVMPQRPLLINSRRDDSFEMYDPRIVGQKHRPHRATVPQPRYY